MNRSVNTQVLSAEIKRLYLDGLSEENVVEELKKDLRFNSIRRATVQSIYRNLVKTLPKIVVETNNTSANDSIIFVGERNANLPICRINGGEIAADTYNSTQFFPVPRLKKRRRVTMFHSLVTLKDLAPSPEPSIENKEEDLSSFIEIIVYDENGQEKRPEKTPIDFRADQKENREDKENKFTIVKNKKKNNRKKRVVIVAPVDPTLLKLPSASCLKSALINPNQVEKHFRFADTRNEAPLCDIKEVDYSEGIRYDFRRSTKKKVNFGETL